jgi:uncharacterized protein YkwD
MLLLLLLLLAGHPESSPPSPAAGGCSAPPHAALRQEFLERINAVRRERGLLPLRLSDPLCRAAQERAGAVARNEAALDAMGGDDLLRHVERKGYDAKYASELLMQASGTPAEMLAGWRRDLPAGESFGRPETRDLGIGVAEVEETPLYAFLFALEAKQDFQERTAGLATRDDLLDKMLAMVNAERRKHLKNTGRPPSVLDLRRNALLDRAAQGHADDMLARSFYGHDDPEGKDAWHRARAAGYRGWIVGENIAQGQSSVDEVMQGWMHSPDHRRNILNLEYTEAGFGLAVGKNAQGYQVLWVQVFGKPR